MVVEIEKKYRLTEALREAIINALGQFGAEYLGDDFEENTIYGGNHLFSVVAAVRIRRTDKRSLLTFKKQIDGLSDLKHRLEHETEISDPASTHQILVELGLEARLVYEKRRRTWRFRATEVVIDELPFGLFMEIEGSLTAIKEAEMLLGIEDLEPEYRTYPNLTAELGARNGDITEARFASGK